MVRIGLPSHGKIVIYPVRRNIDGRGSNLVNWVVEIDRDDFNDSVRHNVGMLADFQDTFADWRFEWLDIPEFLKHVQGPVLEFPMMDRDPLDTWGSGRITLLGDAAHPMVPLGSNGGGQAILDATSLAAHLASETTVQRAFERYEAERRPYTANIVLGDRRGVVDAMVREVDRRTDSKPFTHLADVISSEELVALSSQNYQSISTVDRR